MAAYLNRINIQAFRMSVSTRFYVYLPDLDLNFPELIMVCSENVGSSCRQRLNQALITKPANRTSGSRPPDLKFGHKLRFGWYSLIFRILPCLNPGLQNLTYLFVGGLAAPGIDHESTVTAR